MITESELIELIIKNRLGESFYNNILTKEDKNNIIDYYIIEYKINIEIRRKLYYNILDNFNMNKFLFFNRLYLDTKYYYCGFTLSIIEAYAMKNLGYKVIQFNISKDDNYNLIKEYMEDYLI